ncbi:MAG: UDP- glucuronosyltransferase [Bacteroidetes bacterium]|nr:UDP- glucuronosyltransferase [Bacteroidota bacterium]
MKDKKVVFVIQGEGRGHFSQAITAKEILEQAGAKVSACFIGVSKQRKIPDYVFERLNIHTQKFESPNFLKDRNNQGIRVGKSVVHHLLRLPKHVATASQLANGINKLEPDLVLNFYEPLVGFSQLFKRINAPIICVGHQYMSLIKGFDFPKGRRLERLALKTLSQISRIRAKRILALSFYEWNNSPKPEFGVIGPLIRPLLNEYTPEPSDFYLIYVLNKGYADEIQRWHSKNQHIKLECFWDGEDNDLFYHHENLRFNKLNDVEFIAKLSKAKGLISTAGFESICEALFFSKKAMMVPVKGHYEQFLNAYDAQKDNAGIQSAEFDLDKRAEIPVGNRTDSEWLKNGNQQFMNELNLLLA